MRLDVVTVQGENGEAVQPLFVPELLLEAWPAGETPRAGKEEERRSDDKSMASGLRGLWPAGPESLLRSSSIRASEPNQTFQSCSSS